MIVVDSPPIRLTGSPSDENAKGSDDPESARPSATCFVMEGKLRVVLNYVDSRLYLCRDRLVLLWLRT